MPQTKHTRRTDKDKDLISRLTEAGEDVLHRLEELPGGKAMAEAATSLRKRLDELAVRLRSLDPLEKRVSALEKRLEALERRTKAEEQESARPAD